MSSEDSAESVSTVEPAARKPRVRSGAIAWGVIVIGIAVSVLVTVGSPTSRRDFAEWLGDLTTGSVAIIGVLALGVLILLLAGLALIRRAQRR